jgi:hypothetical protein
MKFMPNIENCKLSSSVTIARYRKLEAEQKREEISDFIQERFKERYIIPLESIPTGKKHGFCIMAVCCLMIEALESFRQGWVKSKGKSKAAFCYFFDDNEPFRDFCGYAQEFYNNVRCGILHQAETTGGWRIKREGTLFDSASKIINATKFLKELAKCLENYCDELKKSHWNSDLWQKVRKKMNAICANCDP